MRAKPKYRVGQKVRFKPWSVRPAMIVKIESVKWDKTFKDWRYCCGGFQPTEFMLRKLRKVRP